jgi:hypothetical protein
MPYFECQEKFDNLGLEIDKSPPCFLDSGLFAAEAAALSFIPKNARQIVPATLIILCQQMFG